jgi:hypothetical protein
MTSRFDDGATWAKVAPENVTAEERRLIMEGSLGYCESHQNLYRKFSEERIMEMGAAPGMTQCPVFLTCCKCPDPDHTPKITDFPPCKEW